MIIAISLLLKLSVKILHKQHKTDQEHCLGSQQEGSARAHFSNIEQGSLQPDCRDRDNKAGM